MTRDEEVKNPRLFDSRTIERNIRKGLITRKDYEKHLKGLPDVTDKIAPPEAPRSYVAAERAAAGPDLDHLDAHDVDEDLDDEDEVEVEVEAGAKAAGADGDDEGDDEAAGDDDLDDDDDDDLADDTDGLEDPEGGAEEPPRN